MKDYSSHRDHKGKINSLEDNMNDEVTYVIVESMTDGEETVPFEMVTDREIQ
ncbi:hypothetical protein ACQKL5_11410 [Peribacillus sp. NPDC097675]|uniref:hypothetical protein n=1 Tax=Peribacillus sp. NPDC097675 TaxID=3390618 RepID=UPI003CFD10DC